MVVSCSNLVVQISNRCCLKTCVHCLDNCLLLVDVTESLAFCKSSMEAFGILRLIRKDSSVSKDPSSVIIGSCDTLMAEKHELGLCAEF